MTMGELCAEFLAIAVTAGSVEEIADRVAEVLAEERLVPEVTAFLAAQ